MRTTTVFRRLLGLQGIHVTDVRFHVDSLAIIVNFELRRRLMVCGQCGFRSRSGGYDGKERNWRHLDLGPWELYLRGWQRRFECRRCATVVTEQMPFAEVGSVFTRDFEDVTSYLAQQTNKTAVSRLMKIAWPTVGNIIERTVARCRLPLKLRRLYRIGLDEISYRRHHKYLTLVADHESGEIVWGGDGKSGETLDRFLDQLGDEARGSIKLVSLDMSGGYIAKLRERLSGATLVFDPFHVVKLANAAVDEVRRAQVRALDGKDGKRAIKKTRWILLKAGERLDIDEQERLAGIARVNRPLYRAYLLKEALRSVYDETPRRARRLLDAWLAWAQRSRLRPFVKLGRTFREYRDGILAAIQHGLSNGRLEGLNSKVRLLSHRAFGFRTADALLALVYLCCSGIELSLPSDRRFPVSPYALQ